MASATEDLSRFVHDALAKGASRDEIQSVLTAAGWPTAQTRSVLDDFADLRFPVPVPKPRPRMSAREAFLYLILFSTLYVASFHVGSLLFSLIERTWPDPTDPSYRADGLLESMRWSVASVVIALPVFLFVANYLSKELTRNPVHRLSPVRRWLTYLTLFLAAGVLIGDMITLVYNLLGGELTVRFLLKVLVVGALAGSIFGYYLHDLRREERDA
jgi:hypothetical protein